MSTLIQPTPLPAHGPKSAPPVHIPARGGLGWLWTLLGLGTLAGLGFLGYTEFNKQQSVNPLLDATTAKTTKAVTGAIEARIRIPGQTSAKSFSNVIAPLLRGPEARNPLVLMKLTSGGSRVKRGDLVAQIDGGWLVDHIDEVKDQIRQAENDVAKRKSEQLVEMENLQQTIRVAKAAWDKAKLEFQAAEVRTEVERELLKLTLDETEARYRQQLADVKEKAIAHDSELKILGVTVERHRRHHDRHAGDQEKYSIRAQIDGLVVMSQYFRGSEMTQIQNGDQINPGQAIMKIVDPASMQVEGYVNQAESDQIRIGQQVSVGFDSIPGMRLRGRVAGLNALAKSGFRDSYFLRNVGVRIQILDQDSRLIPDLSAFGDVLIEKSPSGVHVPSGAVIEEAGKEFLYVKNGPTFEKRPVVTGFRSNTETIITEGLKAGEEVRIN